MAPFEADPGSILGCPRVLRLATRASTVFNCLVPEVRLPFGVALMLLEQWRQPKESP